MFIHEFKQLDFNLSLIEERLLVLNDLDSDLFLIHKVVRLHHLHNDNAVRVTLSKHCTGNVRNKVHRHQFF